MRSWVLSISPLEVVFSTFLLFSIFLVSKLLAEFETVLSYVSSKRQLFKATSDYGRTVDVIQVWNVSKPVPLNIQYRSIFIFVFSLSFS